jgi:predicted ATPase
MKLPRVITGGPGTGKTTLIQALEDEGWPVQHEVAREFIRRAALGEPFPTPNSDLKAFSALVFQARKQQYEAAQSNTFLDRGVPDAMAYLQLHGLPIPVEMTHWCRDNRYHPIVWMAPPWQAIFHPDAERVETYADVLAVDQVLRSTYRSLGYSIQDLPRTSVAERVVFLKEYSPLL